MSAINQIDLPEQSERIRAAEATIPARIGALLRQYGIFGTCDRLGITKTSVYRYLSGGKIIQPLIFEAALEYAELGHDPQKLDTSDIPAAIRHTCKTLGVNVHRLSKIIGCSQPNLSYWMNETPLRGRQVMAACLAMTLIRHGKGGEAK